MTTQAQHTKEDLKKLGWIMSSEIVHFQGCDGETKEVTVFEDTICFDCREHCEAIKEACACGAIDTESSSSCCGSGFWNY